MKHLAAVTSGQLAIAAFQIRFSVREEVLFKERRKGHIEVQAGLFEKLALSPDQETLSGVQCAAGNLKADVWMVRFIKNEQLASAGQIHIGLEDDLHLKIPENRNVE